MGFIMPDGAELSSGLTVGMQSCSVKYMSSSFCVQPIDGGARDSNGVSTMWLYIHSVAPGLHRPLVTGVSGGQVFAAARLEGQRVALARVTFRGKASKSRQNPGPN